MHGKYKTTSDGKGSISDGFLQIIERKQNASSKRFLPREERTEESRQVFLTCCEAISSALSTDGYRFAKSGPHCTKKHGDFSYKVSFLSDHYNVAGEHVALTICGSVHSRKYKKWQTNLDLNNPSDYVAGGQIGYLTGDYLNFEWELAEPSVREEVVEGAIMAIRELAFPFFERFEFIDTVVKDVIAGRFPLSCHPVKDMKLLMFLAGCSAAREYATRCLIENPGLQDEYLYEYRKYSGEGLYEVVSSEHSKALASAVHFFELGNIEL